MNSTPGEGSIFEFTMTLGMAPDSKYPEKPCCLKSDQPNHDKLKGARVILVDTHPVRQVFFHFHAFDKFRRQEFLLVICKFHDC